MSGTIYLLSKISPRSRFILILAPLALFFPLLPRTPKSQTIFAYILPALVPFLSKDQVSMLCSSTAFPTFCIMIAYTSFFPTGESSARVGPHLWLLVKFTALEQCLAYSNPSTNNYEMKEWWNDWFLGTTAHGSQVPNFSVSEGNEKEPIWLMKLSNCFWEQRSWKG